MAKSSPKPWYGRPNPPPLNWDKLESPIIRQLAGSDAPAPTEPFITVRLAASDWIMVLKALYLYGQQTQDADWEEWRLAIRAIILEAVDAQQPGEASVAFTFTLPNWRQIWRAARDAAQQQGAGWQPWFQHFDQQLTPQIQKQLDASAH